MKLYSLKIQSLFSFYGHFQEQCIIKHIFRYMMMVMIHMPFRIFHFFLLHYLDLKFYFQFPLKNMTK